MLEEYKNQYINQSIQFVCTDFDGVILESDQTFFQVDEGKSIQDVDPFFLSFDSVIESQEDIVTLNCIHLSLHHQEFIADVKFIKKPTGILIAIYDLTEHYISYQKIAQARNESVINEEFVALKNSELQERERFKNKFIQNFSHELRNPLTSIISITNVIESTDLTNEQQRMLDFLKDSNSNLKLMLDDILSISMISSGKLQLRHKAFNLHNLLQV